MSNRAYILSYPYGCIPKGTLWLTEFEIGPDIRHSGPTTLDVKAAMFRDAFAFTHVLHSTRKKKKTKTRAAVSGEGVNTHVNSDGSQVPASICGARVHNFADVPIVGV